MSAPSKSETAAVEPESTLSQVVDYRIPFEAMLLAGKYNVKDGRINPAYFSIQGTGGG